MKRNLLVYSRGDFYDLISSGGIPKDAAVIQICSTPKCQEVILGEPEPHFLLPSDTVLNLTFDDIGKRKLVYEGSTFYGMSPKQAKEVVSFIEKNKDRDFYISCRAGKSRSQGIARYILDTYGHEIEYATREDNPCVTPNMYVTQLLKKYKK